MGVTQKAPCLPVSSVYAELTAMVGLACILANSSVTCRYKYLYVPQALCTGSLVSHPT